MAVDPVTGGLAVADDGLKLVLQKDGQFNTQAEVDAKVAKELQALRDAITQAIEKGATLDEIRLFCAN